MRSAPVMRGGLAGLALAAAAVLPADAATPALLFRADFDHAGACSSRTEPGVGGRGKALLLRPGDECAFPAAGHANPRAGTLSFWARPQDWSDGEGRYQVLFEWSGNAGGDPFELYVDSPAEAGTVRLVVAFGAGRDPDRQLFQISAPVTWRAGLWQKVDVSWDEHEIVIYGNGVAGDRLPLETVRLPAPAEGRFRITPGPGLGQRADATAVDEVELWDAALPADRIAKRHTAWSATPLAPAALRAPRITETPRIDGGLGDPVWARATRVPLVADAETGFAGLLVAHAAFAWSQDALWVALEAPLTDATDAFELALAPRAGNRARSLRITPAGLGEEDAGAEASAEAAARSSTEIWTAELAIPWELIGVPGRDARELRLDLVHRPAAPGALGVGARLAGASLTLGEEGEGVRIAGGPELALGRLELELERSAGAEAELTLTRQGRPWRRSVRVRSREELREQLPAPADGVLTIDVRDAAGRTLARLESRVAPLDVPGLLPVPDTRARRLGIELDLGWLDGRWQKALAARRASARLVDRGPELVEGPLPVELREGRGRVQLASGLEPGRHELALELASADETLTFTRRLDPPELPWLGTKVGESEGVLDPWLPLGWDDDATVRVWGRRYGFAGPLIARVEGRGGPMLRAPMELRLQTAAGVSRLRTSASEVTKRSAARAEFRGSGSFDVAGVEVAWQTSIEYDGLVLTTLTLAPKAAGTRVDQLVLEVPLESRLVKYLRGTRRGSAIWRGRVPWNGRRFQSAFEPFLWVTNEEEGFLWFSESAANWVGAERRGAVEVRGGPDAGVTLRLIGEPVELPGPLTYTFGFQATPVKPMLADARAWNFGMAGKPTSHERAIAYFDTFAVADGLWELQRPMAVAEFDRQLARRGTRPFYYGAVSATPDFDPVFRLFAPLWRSAWSVGYPARAHPDSAARDAIPEHRFAAVCPADPDWQDRMLFDADRLLRATGGIGVYTDTDEVWADDNPRHGCGYVDAFGKRGVTWGILAKRRFAKRLATLLRSSPGGRAYWMSHAHTQLVPPVHGFADFWYPGEELTGNVSRSPWFYMDGLDETAWRVEYRGESSGIVHVLLPELERGGGRVTVEDPAYTESLLAMAAVNDVNVSSPYTNVMATGEYWGLRERLGLVPAEFVGHWRADCPLRALSSDGRASLYRTRRGPVLVVANRAAVAHAVDLDLNAKALRLSEDFVARDERSGQTLERRGDRLVVPLPARSYTYVSLRE